MNTPPAGAIDPRRAGISSTGSYWGGGGEQIDTLSGNLNFSAPLVTPRGRPGWTVPLNLNYNSQNWRQDNSVNWDLGADVGYGFGWKAQIGSITPYYSGYSNGVDHYVYADGSGAQYRLDQNSGNVWSSLQGIYVWFDANAGRLHFKDGTFWTMGSTSGGTEFDAGTMYPTIVEDVSGNQAIVTYLAAAGLSSSATNTSARISTIEDGRASYSCINSNYNGTQVCSPAPSGYTCISSNGVISCATSTYQFTWNTDSPVPHLTGVSNGIGTAEAYALTYASSQEEPPFGTDPKYSGISATRLATMTNTSIAAGTYDFTYDSAGASELTEVTFPTGGHLRWNYISFEYNGVRTLREVGTRYLAADPAGMVEWTYPITRPDASNSVTVHSAMTLADASGIGAKTWSFIQPSGSNAWQVGLASGFTQLSSPTGTVYTSDAYTWVAAVTPPAIRIFRQRRALKIQARGTSRARSPRKRWINTGM